MGRSSSLSLSMDIEEISSASFSSLRLIDKSAVIKTPLYFAAQSLFPEKFSEIVEDDGTRALLKVLGPGLFGALLALVYMHRRFNKICGSEQWQELSKEYVFNMELGFLIGQKAKGLTPADGVIAAGLRTAALAIFLKHDPEGYVGYRNRKMAYNLEFEHTRWGCDHGQVGGGLAKAIGFPFEPMDVGYAIRGGAPGGALHTDLKSWRTVLMLLPHVVKPESSSLDVTKLPIPVDEDDMIEIKTAALGLAKRGSQFEWMFSRSDRPRTVEVEEPSGEEPTDEESATEE